MTITDLKAHMMSVDASQSPSFDDEEAGLSEAMASMEAEFRLLREECVRTRNLIEDREQKGRTLIEAYRHVISDFTDLFEAQRKESQKRDEAVQDLLSSVETRILADLERLLAPDGSNEGNNSHWALFRRKS